MSNIGINPSVAVASLDLTLVQLLRQAIRTADISSAAAAGSGGVGRSVAHVESVRQSSVVSVDRSATGRHWERPVDRFERSPLSHLHPRRSELQSCPRPVSPADAPSSIQPPWKVLPWPKCTPNIHYRACQRIKLQSAMTDVSAVGRTLDLFV